MTEQRCRTCRWWDQPRGNTVLLGECVLTGRSGHNEETEPDYPGSLAIVTAWAENTGSDTDCSYDIAGVLRTAGEFGCTQWQAKEQL